MMTWREIRASFLEYFERNGHRVVPSSSLVPHDDPSLLFTNAGMNQFKDVFLGKEQRDYKRAASCQKCMRVSGKHNDLENVGPSPSHHTFFQMLGNFSFGDYFKKDAIGFAWELLTDVWKIPQRQTLRHRLQGRRRHPERRRGARALAEVRLRGSSLELGSDDNFWQMGDTGPCGRCSEIYYFRGNQIPCPEPVCRGVECSCSRYIEIWNNVFMEFDRQAGWLAEAAACAFDRHRHGTRAHHAPSCRVTSRTTTPTCSRPSSMQSAQLAGKKVRPLDEPGRCVDARRGRSLARR